jgi:rhodanese-related sulfurtransferase
MPKSLKDYVTDALQTVREVTPEEARELQQQGGYVILDVREPEEFEAGHLEGAVSVPRGFLEVKADLEHPKRDPRLADRNLKILCYCGGGHRSALAAKTLQEMGFADPLTMAEGWTGWTKRGLPTEK